ncbi:hypothetical protein OG936_27835 [Streptomyces sp. NBC_00846]|uniref:hypothetical protein n=1 Tax=Streptomyces sp. NBC_00846 TaxID=2975849 RepID=UPI0038638AE0|nr:hypothetical protein OG936_27835 [Streptomyces sp. NBC_00846]
MIVALLVVFWAVIWPYLVGALVFGGAVVGGWWMWRTDRLIKGGDGGGGRTRQ